VITLLTIPPSPLQSHPKHADIASAKPVYFFARLLGAKKGKEVLPFQAERIGYKNIEWICLML